MLILYQEKKSTTSLVYNLNSLFTAVNNSRNSEQYVSTSVLPEPKKQSGIHTILWTVKFKHDRLTRKKMFYYFIDIMMTIAKRQHNIRSNKHETLEKQNPSLYRWTWTLKDLKLTPSSDKCVWKFRLCACVCVSRWDFKPQPPDWPSGNQAWLCVFLSYSVFHQRSQSLTAQSEGLKWIPCVWTWAKCLCARDLE